MATRDNASFEKALAGASLTLLQNEPLAKYTTIEIGGPARFFVRARSSAELERVVRLAHTAEIPLFVLGKGSNVIISDRGFDGLVVLNEASHWHIVDQSATRATVAETESRFQRVDDPLEKLAAFDYSEDQQPDVLVRVASGARISVLIKELLKQGITGLQWFSGIPATVGGAVYMNMHGGAHYFGDYVMRAAITDGVRRRVVTHDYFQFDYDWCRLHDTAEIVLHADLALKRGDVDRARKLAQAWAKQKARQPQRSAGCIFQNLTAEQQQRLNLATSSVGYVIDKLLHLKGKRVGGAMVSEDHAAFIVNCGNATAADVVELIAIIKGEAAAKLDLELQLEVKLIGKL